MGTKYYSSGDIATAWGNGSVASGRYATAWGENTEASGVMLQRGGKELKLVITMPQLGVMVL